MKLSLLPLLCCPFSRGPLVLDTVERTTPKGEIESGTLRAPDGRAYAIVRGVPHVYGDYRSDDEKTTVQAFGDEWARYDDFDGYMGSAELFAEFSGLAPEQLAGRRILEVGCGGGRWLRVMAGWGASEVVGLDFSSSVEQAARLTTEYSNVHVVRGSAIEMPLAPMFDVVVSIGVIHHLDDPVLGLLGIRRAVRERHLVAIWVYAKEGNETYLRIVRPLRRIGPKLPRPVLAGVSRGLAAALWTYIHSVNRIALVTGLPLPLREYLGMLQRLRFRDVESVVYDQLTPSLARYPSKDEVEEWVTRAGGRPERLYHRTSNSWQCHFTFPPATAT
jgi:SAM-dependent methyltransferase